MIYDTHIFINFTFFKWQKLFPGANELIYFEFIDILPSRGMACVVCNLTLITWEFADILSSRAVSINTQVGFKTNQNIGI